jgi:hypothetical protein
VKDSKHDMLKNNNGPLKKINHDISDCPFLEKIIGNMVDSVCGRVSTSCSSSVVLSQYRSRKVPAREKIAVYFIFIQEKKLKGLPQENKNTTRCKYYKARWRILPSFIVFYGFQK